MTAPDSDVPATLERPWSPAPSERPGFWGWVGRHRALAGGLAVLGVAGSLLLVRALTGGAKGKGADPAGRPVPIVAAQARKGDLGVTLTALGTVTPLNAVTVRSRVDGHLQSVAFQEGQFVREGDLLAQIDPRPFQVQLMQAEGQQARDQAALRNATMDLQRLQSLVVQGVISRQQLDAQTSTVNQLEAALKSDQAQVESAKLNLTYSRITAPISGRAGLRLVDPGNMVRASESTGIAVIAPVQPINILFTIPADSIQRVMAQSRGGKRLATEAFDRDMRSRLGVGHVQAIDNQVDPATGTVKMKALFPNDDQALFPNQFVNVRLLVDTLKDVVLVPTAAIQRSPQGTFVYVVKEGAVEMRPVQVEATEGDETALRGGLQPGESVVVEGLEKLRPGSRVALPDAAGAPAKKARP